MTSSVTTSAGVLSLGIVPVRPVTSLPLCLESFSDSGRGFETWPGHVVTVSTEIRDADALRLGCRRLQLPDPVYESVSLFSQETTGHSVRLPDWRYPVVCQLETGTVEYDNFNGRWGEQRQLDRLLQAYAVEMSTRPRCPPANGPV